mgnify:CR=1 FL=1
MGLFFAVGVELKLNAWPSGPSGQEYGATPVTIRVVSVGGVGQAELWTRWAIEDGGEEESRQFPEQAGRSNAWTSTLVRRSSLQGS